MHSSRMRTGRSLTVCCSRLPGGVVLPARMGGSPCWGGSTCQGVLPARGGSPCQRGGLSGWGVLLGPRGVLPAGGVLPPRWGWGSPCRVGGLCLVPGGGSPETPPVNRITDTCKNITLATTSLRPVMTCMKRK